MRIVESLVVVLLFSWAADAFVGVQKTTTTTTTHHHASSTRLFYELKQAGGGIPAIPSGNLLLFDPNVEGMTGDLDARLNGGVDFAVVKKPESSTYLHHDEKSPASTTTTAGVETIPAQAFLEDIGVPTNFAKPTAPATATVLGRMKLIDDDAPGDIQHVLLQLPEGMHYVEGQSLSVIPPGTTENGKNHKPRLYSIASTRYGDLLDGKTVSLCVRRAEYVDPATGLVDDSKKGVCSNFLCDIQKGDKIQVAGPIGKTMLLPEDPSKDIIMVATGTGIAPFRAFLHRLFMENTIARNQFTGNAWLILGVPTTGGLLYPQELAAMQQNCKASGLNNLEIDYAISREMTNQQGGKLYVQHVLAEQADKLLDRLMNGAQIYFCGLKGMMPGILEALEEVAEQRGLDWNATLKQLQANHQWHVEVY